MEREYIYAVGFVKFTRIVKNEKWAGRQESVLPARREGAYSRTSKQKEEIEGGIEENEKEKEE